MSSVDWDVAGLTRDLLENNWNSNNVSKPTIVVKTEEKRIDTAQDDYIVISEVSDREQKYADARMNTMDKLGVSRAEIKTNESRQRREDLWAEVRRIAIDHRSQRRGLPGGWDRLEFRSTTFDDDAFGKYVAECDFRFKATSQTV